MTCNNYLFVKFLDEQFSFSLWKKKLEKRNQTIVININVFLEAL